MNPPDAEGTIFTVTRFTQRVAQWFVRQPLLADVRIRGEIADLHDYNGHLYFSLKDDGAILKCVAWASKRAQLPDLRNRDEIVARGPVRVYHKLGIYELFVEGIESVGAGGRQYEQLKKKFEDEGLFAPERKVPVPELLRRVALVSAQTGYGADDFLEIVRRDVPFVRVDTVWTRVQGIGAEVDIATALDTAARLPVEAVVLLRGGGDDDARSPFDSEPVVRAIVRCKTPVVTAIAHTRNVHLADLVADRYFGTPTAAADYIVAGWSKAKERFASSQAALDRAVRILVAGCAQQLAMRGGDVDRAGSRTCERRASALFERIGRLDRRSPQRLLADLRARVGRAVARLNGVDPQRLIGNVRALTLVRSGRLNAAAAQLAFARSAALTRACGALDNALDDRKSAAGWRLERTRLALDALDPLAPLERGYAIVTHAGKALRDATAVHVGDAVEARLYRGMLVARVEKVSES